MKHKVLHILRDNARLTNEQIAHRVGSTPQEVATIIAELEATKAIVGYKAIVNPDVIDETTVEAIIEVNVTPKRGHGFDEIARRIALFPEVQSVYLMSGGSDFLIFMEGPSIKEIAAFVTETLATLEDVQGTTTHFVLKKFKKDGVLLREEVPATRLAVSP
jgi:DNA-binding Lrp family transcriptional regulator